MAGFFASRAKKFPCASIQIRKAADISRQQAGRNVRSGWGNNPRLAGNTMTKILSTAIVAALLFGITAPAFAADAPPAPTPPAAKADAAAAPKTKADCNKLTDMKWDKKTKTCVKK
jgi:hypothetical protein